MNASNTTIIICCAGMGTRLGIGTTKALIDICNKPLIIRLIKQLDEFDDIRIVIGYQAEKVISVVNEYRKDILYAFNYDYEVNGPAASMWKALFNARENIIVLDGDLVIENKDFKKILSSDCECIAYTDIKTDEPIYLDIIEDKVTKFSNAKTQYIWPGIVKIKKKNINFCNGYVYESILNNLPMKAVKVKAIGIDTQDDYEKAIEWFQNTIN